ncbi:MAG TPA: TerC family protein [Humisphaera sp.]
MLAAVTVLASSWVVSAAAVGPEGGLTSLFSPEAIVALVTLAGLEIVLGIDNIVFLSILVAKLPVEQQAKARRMGLGLAMGMRILLLLAIGWIMGLVADLFYIPKFWTSVEPRWHGVSGRDLILLIGGLFLMAKATHEIHAKLEGPEHDHEGGGAARKGVSFASILVQIMLLDIVFSLDSVITAVGMVKADKDHHWIALTVMITAVVISVGVMLVAAGPIARFVDKHPTVKMLALSFLILVGVVLVIEGAGGHVEKGYVYFAMAFSLGVEMLNLRLKKAQAKPVKLHSKYTAGSTEAEISKAVGDAAAKAS